VLQPLFLTVRFALSLSTCVVGAFPCCIGIGELLF
jgi:hypothetical protein